MVTMEPAFLGGFIHRWPLYTGHLGPGLVATYIIKKVTAYNIDLFGQISLWRGIGIVNLRNFVLMCFSYAG